MLNCCEWFQYFSFKSRIQDYLFFIPNGEPIQQWKKGFKRLITPQAKYNFVISFLWQYLMLNYTFYKHMLHSIFLRLQSKMNNNVLGEVAVNNSFLPSFDLKCYANYYFQFSESDGHFDNSVADFSTSNRNTFWGTQWRALSNQYSFKTKQKCPELGIIIMLLV